MPYCTHLADDRRNSSGNRFGQGACQEKGQGQHCNINSQELKHQNIALRDQRLGRKDRHHKPSGLPDPVKSNINCLSKDFLLHIAVGRHIGFHDLVVIQPVYSGKGIAGSRYQVVSLIHNVGNAAVQSEIFRQNLVEIIAGVVNRYVSIIGSAVIDHGSMGNVGLVSVCFLFLCTKIKGRAEQLGCPGSSENSVPVGSLGLFQGKEGILQMIRIQKRIHIS